MVLQNYVILEDGIPAKLHFWDHTIERRTITDPTTGGPIIRNVLVLEVDTLNDRPCAARLSTMAEKLADKFSAYLPDKGYRGYDFVITQSGEGFRRTWSVKVIPRAK